MGSPRARRGAALTAAHLIVERLDRLQRRHAVVGFAYAVARKYADDGGGREAALITYYGFLSIFPVLLLAVTAVSKVLARYPELRHRLVSATVPPPLQSTVDSAVSHIPTSPLAVAAGLISLLLSGSGVVFSAYQTLNHLAAVPLRHRGGIVSRCVRVVIGVILLLLGVVTVGALTVVTAALPDLPVASRATAAFGSYAVAFVVLLLMARLLLDRPVAMRSLLPAAAPAAAAITITLNAGATVLPGLIRRAGPVYGSFATVAAMFTLLFLLSLALVYAGEIAAVRAARLWPRALRVTRPTRADVRALALLAREQERLPNERIESTLLPRDPERASGPVQSDQAG